MEDRINDMIRVTCHEHMSLFTIHHDYDREIGLMIRTINDSQAVGIVIILWQDLTLQPETTSQGSTALQVFTCTLGILS